MSKKNDTNDNKENPKQEPILNPSYYREGNEHIEKDKNRIGEKKKEVNNNK